MEKRNLAWCPSCEAMAQRIRDLEHEAYLRRDRYREALEDILANEEAYNRGDALSAYIAKNALDIPV